MAIERSGEMTVGHRVALSPVGDRSSTNGVDLRCQDQGSSRSHQIQ
jgi:hypothetical protein